MKRLVILSGLVALLVVPAAHAAPASGATLSADCTICAAGSTIMLTGTGYDASKTYALFVYQTDGSNFGVGIPATAITVDGVLTRALIASAPFFPVSGVYTVMIDLERGHKLIQISSLQLTIQ